MIKPQRTKASPRNLFSATSSQLRPPTEITTDITNELSVQQQQEEQEQEQDATSSSSSVEASPVDSSASPIASSASSSSGDTGQQSAEWGQIRGKIGKLQALGDEMAMVAATLEPTTSSTSSTAAQSSSSSSRSNEESQLPSLIAAPRRRRAEEERMPPASAAAARTRTMSPPAATAGWEPNRMSVEVRARDILINQMEGEMKQRDGILRAQQADLAVLIEELAWSKAEVAAMKSREAEAERRAHEVVRALGEVRQEAERGHAGVGDGSGTVPSEEVDEMCAEYHKKQVVALGRQLQEVRGQLDAATAKSKMATLDHQQEIKCIKWAHELETNRLKWDYQQETERLTWDHKQTVSRLTPTAQKLQKEVEDVTARLLDSQENTRLIKAQMEVETRNHHLKYAKLRLQFMEASNKFDDEREAWESKLAAEESCPSPKKTTICNICMDKEVKMVFPCGHTKCMDCASKLVGLQQDCPDCRAPLGEPHMLFFSVAPG